MANKSILRGLARLLVVVIIGMCAWWLLPSHCGWVTFDIQSTWQSGRLDIDGTLYQSLKGNIEWMKNEYGGEYPINDDNVE